MGYDGNKSPLDSENQLGKEIVVAEVAESQRFPNQDGDSQWTTPSAGRLLSARVPRGRGKQWREWGFE